LETGILKTLTMKSIIKFSTSLLIGILIFISCKKERACENCADKNKPPIAVAGPDQLITLPSDSASLDGSSSSDPDGKISECLWTKISGPASFGISNRIVWVFAYEGRLIGTSVTVKVKFL